MWEEWIEAWWCTWMNRKWICVYRDLCASLESNICMANLSHRHLSLFRMTCGPICGCPALLMQKHGEIVCRVHREWVKSKFLWQDADVMSLADKCIVVGYFVCGDYDKILMETGKFSDNIRVTENGLVPGVDRVLSRRILRFRTLAIDLIHSGPLLKISLNLTLRTILLKKKFRITYYIFFVHTILSSRS